MLVGSLRNQIRGNATFIGNKMGDPDAMEIGNNLVRRNLTCLNNAPLPSSATELPPTSSVAGPGASAHSTSCFRSRTRSH